MSQMRTIVVPPLGLSVAVTSARPKIFITVQKTLDGLYLYVPGIYSSSWARARSPFDTVT